MPDEVILHVGPHKTGSTAIQHMLDAARDELRADGIVYPASGIDDSGHHPVARFCIDGSGSFDPEQLRAELAAAPVALLSSENFMLLDIDGLARLRALVPAARVRVIYHLRGLCDLWPSHWQESVKHGLAWSFGEYVLRQTVGRGRPPGYSADQHEHLSRLAAGFGRGALEIVGYDWLRAGGVDIGRHFQTAILGRADARVTGTAPVVNVSLEPWVVELVRALNAVHRSRFPGLADQRVQKLALGRLAQETPPQWFEEFQGLVAAAPRLELDSESPGMRLLQRRVAGRFADALVGDRAAAEAAYLARRTRRLPLFEIPPAGRERLRRALLDYHLELIGSAEVSRPLPW